MSALKTAAWSAAAVIGGIVAFSSGLGFLGIAAAGAAIFAGMKALGSHKESLLDAAQEVHQNFAQNDRQRQRAQAIEAAYGNDRNTTVGWAEAEAGRGVGGHAR